MTNISCPLTKHCTHITWLRYHKTLPDSPQHLPETLYQIPSGISLAVQWLRLLTSHAGAWIRSLVGELGRLLGPVLLSAFLTAWWCGQFSVFANGLVEKQLYFKESFDFFLL